jgi:hypothetical protein
MAIWRGKKAKRMDALGADSSALMRQEQEKQSAQLFGINLHHLVSGNDRN